jgi:hypothetical protein
MGMRADPLSILTNSLFPWNPNHSVCDKAAEGPLNPGTNGM